MENLYLVMRDDLRLYNTGVRFERAIVYAESAEDACAKVCSYIDLPNEAEASEPSEEERAEFGEDVAHQDNTKGYGPIIYHLDFIKAVLLAANVQRPEEPASFDADDILIFETEWNPPS